MHARALPLLASLSLFCTQALAQDPPSAWKLRAELLTDAPVHGGVAALVEGPHRLRLRTSLGWLPTPYVNLINEVVQAFDDTYTDANAQLVSDTLQNSLVWRTHLGWRPFEGHGFYVHLGYSFVGLGGGTTAQALVEGITGVPIPTGPNNSRFKLDLTTTAALHMADLELGWEWELWDHLTLRVGLGGSYTFASTANITSSFQGTTPPVQQAVDALEQGGEDYLNDTFRAYVHPPSLVTALGWQW